MGKGKTVTRETHAAEKQISVWLPPPFVDGVNRYIKKRQAKNPVARQTMKMLVFDALREFMEKHPEG